MTLVFNKNSWHYRLILYSFGKNFFMDAKIDWKALESIDSSQFLKKDFVMPEKYIAKTVNLCPYCRALLGAFVTLPFLFIWKLFPHKEKPPLTREQIKKNSRRRTWASLGIGGGINITFGVSHLIAADAILIGILQIGIGTALITSYYWGQYLLKAILYVTRLVPKRTHKPKSSKPKSQKVTPEFWKKLEKKHDVICPPIFFVDVKENDELR